MFLFHLSSCIAHFHTKITSPTTSPLVLYLSHCTHTFIIRLSSRQSSNKLATQQPSQHRNATSASTLGHAPSHLVAASITQVFGLKLHEYFYNKNMSRKCIYIAQECCSSSGSSSGSSSASTLLLYGTVIISKAVKLYIQI